jgi:phosphatidate phosphatase APP1
MDPRKLGGKVWRGGEVAARATGEFVSDPKGSVERFLRSADTARAYASAEERLHEYREQRKIGSGTFRGLLVRVHRGFVVPALGDEPAQAKVHLQVIEEPQLPDGSSRLPYVDVVGQNLRRYAALPIAGVTVQLRIGDPARGPLGTAEVATGRRGFANASVPMPAEQLHPGWIPVRASAVATDEIEKAEDGHGRVLLPSSTAPYAVISDIDDTVLKTGLTEGLTAFRRIIFRDAHTRQAIPGMASLYRGLARSTGEAAPAGGASPVPFFYVSTGSWSFYEMLTQFLQLRGFPRGPLFLTDWGPTEQYITRSGAEHKRGAIRRLLAAYPELPFVLIGDSGQKDAAIYEEMAREHPGRITAILIIEAGDLANERARDMLVSAPTLRAQGIPMYVVSDAKQMAMTAVSLGLCTRDVIEDVEIELAART